MRSQFLSLVGAALVVFATTSAWGQAKPSITQQQIDLPPALAMDCEGAPAAAVVKVPVIVAEWVRISCSVYGHVVGPAAGWLWKQPGAGGLFVVTAQGPRPSLEATGHAANFQSVEAVELPRPEAEDLLNAFFRWKGSASAERVFRLALANQSGERSELYLFTPKPDIYYIVYRASGRTFHAYAVTLASLNR